MADNNYYAEGKYQCNHPESDFISNSKGPIEMKKENFVEYTHRNETANYQYDVWNNNHTTTRKPYNYTTRPSYSYSNNKKSSIWPVVLFIILVWGAPIVMGILGFIIELFEELT